jgi:hypothetical protein
VKHQTFRCERFVFDLPDREVGVASTRSSTAGVHHSQIDAGHGGEREQVPTAHRADDSADSAQEQRVDLFAIARAAR